MTRVIFAILAIATVSPAQPVSFNRDIRPILSDHCFACHGPDAANRQANLRLDLANGARGHEAEILRRIASATTPSACRRPTPASPGSRAREIDLVRTMDRAGRAVAALLVLHSPAAAGAARIKDTAWPRNPIDRFILARLEREALQPVARSRQTHAHPPRLARSHRSPAHARRGATLRRRRFAPTRTKTWSTACSPRPATASAWPTAGWKPRATATATATRPTATRDMWRWRDWVIDAFNRNMPYDRFTIEQLAGDLLPNATLDQQIASGFNRNHRTTGEGGIIPEEYRVEYVADRAQTTATVWMGLTVGCARCHDHKYDPISQKDFYRLFAYFNQIPNERGFVWNYGPEAAFRQSPAARAAEAARGTRSRGVAALRATSLPDDRRCAAQMEAARQ